MEVGKSRRILLVDDHAGFRRSLALVLAAEGIGECLEASGRRDALDIVGQGAADLALVDLSPGTEEALQLVAELCARRIPVLVCSMHEEPSYVRRALAAGARGYVTKREVPQALVRAVRDVLNGWTLISPRASDALH